MISIRRMREEDIPRVSGILCSCYRWLVQREAFSGDELKGLLEVRGSEETVRKESGEELYFVASKKQTIVGMVAVKRTRSPSSMSSLRIMGKESEQPCSARRNALLLQASILR